MASNTTYTCDRCGVTPLKESDRRGSWPRDMVISLEVVIYAPQASSDDVSLDLCGPCYTDFIGKFKRWRRGDA